MLFINTIIFFNIGLFLKKSLSAKFYILLFLIAISTVISNYLSGYYFMPDGGVFKYPTGIILIINKIGVFVFFWYSIYKGYISLSNIIRVSSIVFLFSLAFGLFQFFDLFGTRDIALTYFLESGGVQEHVFISANRIIGTSPAVISWGGCAVLMCHYFLFVEKNKLLRLFGTLFSILNVIGTASRASLFALIGSIFFVFIIKSIIIKKSTSSLLKVFIFYTVFVFTAYFLLQEFLPEQVEFLEKRITNTEEHMTTSGRGEQLNHFKEVLKSDPFSYFFGVGPSVITDYGYLEVDYAYIFVGFGIFGFILHYALLFFLLREAYKLRSYNSNFFLFCAGSTIGYLIFSVGFYFLYELYMGLSYWWLNGIMIGHLYKEKQKVYLEN